MKKAVLISGVILLTMGLAVSSFAVVKKKGMGKGMAAHGEMSACDGYCGCDGSHMEKLKALGLDEKQTEAVQAIHLRTKKDMVRKKADAEVAEIELREVLSKDPVDLNAAEAAVKKIEGLKSEIKMLHIKTMEEIKASLTPEQRKKFIAMMNTGPMGHGKEMRRTCTMKGMGSRGEMDSKDSAPHDGEMSPMRHRHN